MSPNDKPEEKPVDNRIFTGNDEEVSAEQAYNILHSPKFDQVQKNRIKHILATTPTPQQQNTENAKQMMMAISSIKDTPRGELLVSILKCRYLGKYNYKTIAKIMMKSPKGDRPYFASVKKAILYVKDLEKEALSRVYKVLNRPIILP